jgi:hypothetical protein
MGAVRKLKPPAIPEEGSYIRTHMPRRPRPVEEREACKTIAGRRIRQFLHEIGDDIGSERWMAEASRRVGLNYTTARSIIHGYKQNVGPDVVDQISMATGCPVSVFYDLGDEE